MKNLIKQRNGRASKNGSSGEPTWDIALLFPNQGTWTVDEYLAIDGNRLVEFSEGNLEVLPMPTTLHQWMVFLLCQRLNDFVSTRNLGLVLPSPLRVRLSAEKFREPDIVFMLKSHRNRIGDSYWKGADLVVEVVSDEPEDRHRDLVTKRAEYALARIQEYWIEDPREKQITVLWLKGTKYQVHGTYGQGETAASRLLVGFSVDVDEVFAGPKL